MLRPRTFLLLVFLILCAALAPAQEARPLVLTHYMPWYASRETSGAWGWHWTMNHYAPDQILWDGKREAASMDYPLMGLYDSGDDAALECHVLLMKLTGLDGAIVDWYGRGAALDYPANHAHTVKLIAWLKRAGLHYALCYEDQALKAVVQGSGDSQEAMLRQAQEDLRWAEAEAFADAAYVQQEGRPVLLVFGPQALGREAWATLRGGLKSNPMLLGLPHLSKEHGLDGCFAWPPVEGGKTLAPESWRQRLGEVYARGKRGETVVSVVFPGFKDIYQQAGLHASYGSIAPRYGATLRESVAGARESGAKLIQVATWNDHGEGTSIEPTRDHGYRYLELLQRQRPGLKYDAGDLRLPVALYQLRKRSAGQTEAGRRLDQAAELLFEGRCPEAEQVLTQVSALLAQESARFFEDPQGADGNYRLHSEVLYRERGEVSAEMRQRCRLDVYTPATGRPFATVVWFHGGGLTQGERFVPLGLRNAGVGVVAVNYRLSPDVKSPAFLEDAAAAIAWTHRHIAEYGGSAERIYVSGHSAGGYLALMAGLDARWLAAEGMKPAQLAGLIPLSPQVITHYTIREERQISDKQPIVDDYAPLYHVRKDAPPMLIVTGDREKEMLGRYEENAYFWRMMKLVGHPDMTLHELQGYDHGRMAEPALPLVLNFIKAHGPKR